MSLAKLFCQISGSLLLFAMMSGSGSATTSDKNVYCVNCTIKQSYQHIIEAYASLDAGTMTSTYTSDGYYISTGKNKTIVHGAEQLHSLYQHYFEKMKKNNFKLEIKFRVVDRLKDEKSITDVGYYLVSVIPATESDQPIKQHAGKYLITFKKGVNNQWRIWCDANNWVTVDEFNNAKKVGDLFYSTHQSLPKIVPPSLPETIPSDAALIKKNELSENKLRKNEVSNNL